jgi:hypothetical protein
LTADLRGAPWAGINLRRVPDASRIGAALSEIVTPAAITSLLEHDDVRTA